MPNRMNVLYERAKPSRGSAEHQELKAELGGVEPGPDHPRYEDFIRLTDPKPMGRKPIEGQPGARTPEYQRWRRSETESGRASYERQKARQVEKYHEGPTGSGARLRADQRARSRGEIEQVGEAPDWEYGPRLEAEQRERLHQRAGEAAEFYGIDMPTALDVARMHPEGEFPASFRLAATKKPKPKKPRKPEEVWYDVHKHPEGVPGGMGKAPEHHLRARGWMAHEINEGSGKKTIQYRSHDFPDFVLSYGGASGTKPDHNFRVLYMGTNRNVPKVTRAYSVAEAMNKVEELHSIQSGHVVVPMIHDGAASPTADSPSIAGQEQVTRDKTFVAPQQPKRRRDMNIDDYHPIGKPPGYDVTRFPTRPDEASDWTEPKVQVQEIKPVKPKKKAPAEVEVDVTSVTKESIFRLAAAPTWMEA